jgi:RNA polymerase sigma-70 factor (ECF subfamily)
MALKEALARIYEGARGQLRCVAARYVPNDAEDIVQDSFVRALRSSSRFRGDAAPLTWVHRIVVNHSIHLCRKRVVRDAHRRASRPVTWAPASCEDRLAIRMALRKLAREQYRVFVLYEVIGCTHHEIAARLAIPLGTSKWRLGEARKRLQESLYDRNRFARPSQRRRINRVTPEVRADSSYQRAAVLLPEGNRSHRKANRALGHRRTS